MSKRQIFTGLVCGLLLISCGLNNTMYNARKYFRAAQERPLNSNGKPTPQAVDEYTKTIQKCGVIITEQKGSKIIDDALFLLARALYYKGNSAFQAKDQFEALIKGFPDSPHYPEAHIYLARVLRQINQAPEAEKLLESFIRDSRHIKYHPRALMVLAEFEIGDKDYLRAQYWLQRIINDYSHTPEFREAFFLFGKNYYEQKDYPASLREFEKLDNTRGISKELRLEARYYMALSLFEMGELDRSSRLVASLINEESRPEKLSQVRVLKARLLLAGDDPQKGITEVDDISKAYPRSLSSAAAYYHLGDNYFYRLRDINQASTAYNKVRTEFPASELVAPSQQKVNALNQLKQSGSLSPTASFQQFVDYHMLAAENYLSAFALSDSALVMYDRVIAVAGPIREQMDSLNIQLDNLRTTSDSLVTRIAELEAIQAVKTDPTEATPTEIDSILAVPDSTALLPDSLITLPNPVVNEVTEPADSLGFSEIKEISVDAEPVDSIATATEAMKEKDPADDLDALRQQSGGVKTQLASLDTQIKELNGILTRLDTEILPLVYFAKASLLNRLESPQETMRDLQSVMESRYPANKYTNALRMLISGQPLRLVDPEEDRQSEVLDRALGLYLDQPDSMRVLLEELSLSQYPLIRLRSEFRLGWMHSFELADTLAAKPYFDKVLEHPHGDEYATAVRKFYDGKNFMFPKPAQDSTVAADSLKVDEESQVPEDPGAGPEMQQPNPDPLIPEPVDLPEPDAVLPESQTEADIEEGTQDSPLESIPQTDVPIKLPEDLTPPNPPPTGDSELG